MPFAGYEDFDACTRDNSDKEDSAAYCAQIHYEATGEWPAEKYEKQFGDDAVISTPIEVAEIAVDKGDVPRGTWRQIDSDRLAPFVKLAKHTTDARRFKSAIDMVKLSREGDVSNALAKADTVAKVDFDAEVNDSMSMVFKQDGQFLIWGPASVEVVDKENDKIDVDALDKALPQLLKRAQLSYAHTDQLVGKILERFETDESVEVQIGDRTYERKTFPTSVLDLDDGQPPGMFVAGEVYDDTKQSQEVREKIEDGEINSYSISGEALVTQKQIDGDMVYDDILEMDLSAVTLCEDGMNEEAKFAQVDSADVSNVVDANVEKSEPSYEVEGSGVSSPEQVTASVSKSMSSKEEDHEDDEEEMEEEKGERTLPEGDIATKEDLDKALEQTVEKTAEVVVEKVEDIVPDEDAIEQKAQDAAKSALPDGDLATVSYIESNYARKGDYEEEEDEEMEEEEKGDYEEEEMEEGDDDEMPEEMEEEMEDDEKGEDDLTREQLKEDLPGDVWDVVSEYVGDTKEAEDVSKSDELEDEVEAIIEGTAVKSPGVDLSERADEQDDLYKAEDQEEEDRSPALNHWR